MLPAIALLTVFLQNCEDYETVEVPNFTVSPSTTNAKVGEPVTFNITNSPEFLMFFSGEPGHEYKYKDRTKAEGTVTLSFKSAQKFGLGENAEGTLSLLVSKDYDGSGTPESIENATWTDLSDQVEIATAYDFAWTDSGVLDITSYGEDTEPVYFAFRFKSKGHKGNGNRQPEWRVTDFLIELAVSDNAKSTVADLFSPGFSTVDVEGVNDDDILGNWYLRDNEYYRFRGGPMTEENEDWLISYPINLTKVNPDEGMPIKSYAEKLDAFTHTYSAPGTYTVTFVGNNTTIYGSEEAVKETSITVTE